MSQFPHIGLLLVLSPYAATWIVFHVIPSLCRPAPARGERPRKAHP